MLQYAPIDTANPRKNVASSAFAKFEKASLKLLMSETQRQKIMKKVIVDLSGDRPGVYYSTL